MTCDWSRQIIDLNTDLRLDYRSELGLLNASDDGWNFAALCRGEELR